MKIPKTALVAIAIMAMAATVTDVEAKRLIRGDVGKAARKTANSVEEGVREVGRATRKIADGGVDAIEGAVKKIGHGDVAGAIWDFGTQPIRVFEGAALEAVQNSSLLRFGGQVVANIAVPGGGGAIFTAWYVGRTVDSFSEAARAGAVAALSSYATGAINAGPVETFADGASRAVQSAVVGGVSAVAVGGEFEDGAEAGAIASAANSIYQSYTKDAPDPRSGKEWIGKDRVRTSDDLRDLGQSYKHTGIFSSNPSNSASWAHEGSSFMDMANKVPYVNAGSYMHDMVALDLQLSGSILDHAVSVATIPPAMVFAGLAGGAGRDHEQIDRAAEKAAERIR